MRLETIFPGDTNKPDPFTILVIATPAYETDAVPGTVVADPIMSQPAAFRAKVEYVCNVLFGKLPGQAELTLGTPGIEHAVRVVSHFDPALPVSDANALVVQCPRSYIVEPRRYVIARFVATLGLEVDVVFAVTCNPSHRRSSGLAADDDLERGTTPYERDGGTFHHAHHSKVPGTVALHTIAGSLTALHEFQHALGSYQNGQIKDLNIDGPEAVNRKVGRPIPARFCTYNGNAFNSDTVGKPFGYPNGWMSYHCEHHDPDNPSLMDDYWFGKPPVACQNDHLTRAFVLDRLHAKIRR